MKHQKSLSLTKYESFSCVQIVPTSINQAKNFYLQVFKTNILHTFKKQKVCFSVSINKRKNAQILLIKVLDKSALITEQSTEHQGTAVQIIPSFNCFCLIFIVLSEIQRFLLLECMTYCNIFF